MTPNDLEKQNEYGDTCLHHFLPYLDNNLIERMIEKQPNLSRILNNEKRSILHYLTNNLYQQRYRFPLILKLITEYQMDYQQEDITGLTPFQSGSGGIQILRFDPKTACLFELD